MTRTDHAIRTNPAAPGATRSAASPAAGTGQASPNQAALARNLASPPQPLSLRMFLGRSLFPLLALTLISGTVLWGPWITLLLAVAAWTVVGRLG